MIGMAKGQERGMGQWAATTKGGGDSGNAQRADESGEWRGDLVGFALSTPDRHTAQHTHTSGAVR